MRTLVTQRGGRQIVGESGLQIGTLSIPDCGCCNDGPPPLVCQDQACSSGTLTAYLNIDFGNAWSQDSLFPCAVCDVLNGQHVLERVTGTDCRWQGVVCATPGEEPTCNTPALCSDSFGPYQAFGFRIDVWFANATWLWQVVQYFNTSLWLHDGRLSPGPVDCGNLNLSIPPFTQTDAFRPYCTHDGLTPAIITASLPPVAAKSVGAMSNPQCEERRGKPVMRLGKRR